MGKELLLTTDDSPLDGSACPVFVSSLKKVNAGLSPNCIRIKLLYVG